MWNPSACALFETGKGARMGNWVATQIIPMPTPAGICVAMYCARELFSVIIESTPKPMTHAAHPM